MRKFLGIIIGLAIISPVIVQAVPVSWDKSGSVLQPLRTSWSDQVKIPYFTATSTSNASSITHRLTVGTSTGSSAQLELFNQDSTRSTGAIRTISNSSAGADYDWRCDSPNCDLEFVETDQISPAGKYEIDVNNDLLRFNGRNGADNSFNTFVVLRREDHASQGKIGLFTGFGVGSARLELQGTTTLDHFAITSVDGSSGNIFHVKQSGAVGIGTTTPFAKLAVNPVAGDGLSFLVGSSTGTAFSVSNKNFVGIGTANPLNEFMIQSNSSASRDIFAIRNSLGNDIFQIRNTNNMSALRMYNSTNSELLRFDPGANLGAGSFISGLTGFGSTTPFTTIAVGTNAVPGSILVAEHRPATSTSITIDWKNGNQQNIRTGTSATTITFSNATDGGTLKLIVCNPGTSAGAITFATQILWAGGTAPTQTTTANKCDVWSFIATQATSTLKIFGTQTASF